MTKPHPNPRITVPRKVKFVGCCWHLVYYALVIPALVAVFGIATILNSEKDAQTLKVAAYISLAMATSLSICILFYRRKMIRFIILSGLFKSILARHEASKPKKKVRQVAFEVEVKETHFVMVSSTYFVPLEKSFLTKGKEALNRIKTILGEFRFGKANPGYNTTSKQEAAVDIEALKKYKENFSKKLPALEINKEVTAGKKGEKRALEINSAAHALGRRDLVVRQEGDELRVKYTLSSQNHEDVNRFYKEATSPKLNEDEHLCHLCYVNPPNAVLLNCGHGGICHDCALTIVKKKDECLECRGKIEMIYKIDPKPKLSNIVRGTEFTKVVVKMV